MTEEIIIDGVNVAGCEHYCEKLNTGSGIIQNTSKQGFCLHNITGLQNADIYFRVLSFPKCREQSNCHYKQLKRLEQENKKLKYLISEEQCFEEGCNKCTKAYYTDDKYRKALEEINKIAEPRFVNGLNEEADLCNLAMDRIQNKINEVLNEN